MVGVLNRLPQCGVGTRTWTAAHTEYVTVVPGDPSLKNEQHAIDVVLCQHHDEEFQTNGLMGIVTAFGDTITESIR